MSPYDPPSSELAPRQDAPPQAASHRGKVLPLVQLPALGAVVFDAGRRPAALGVRQS
jgi:hypothetical protein